MMHTEHEGYLFDETVETGRIKVKLIIDQSGVLIKDNLGSKRINWSSLDISYGGHNDQQIFFKSKVDTKIVAFTNQKEIIKDIKQHAGGLNGSVVTSLQKGQTKRFLLSGKFLSLLFLFCTLMSGLLLYIYFGTIKKAAAKAVPVEIENSLGETIFKSNVDQTKIIQVPEVNEALKTIFARFKPHLKDQPYEFHFHLIRNEELNAFALPGGYVVVHTGLILEAETVEELAGVLAHEICHVTERHAVERIISSLGIMAICQILLGDISGLTTIIIQGAQFVSMMQFSQSQETEADTQGFMLMKNAKISPLGFMDFFKRAKAKKSDGISGSIETSLSMFSTHPPDDKRIKNIQKLTAQHPYQPESLNIKWDEVKTALKAYLTK